MTIMLALAAIPLFLGAGAAIDTLRVISVQTQLQAATDEAAVAGGTNDKATDKQVEATVSSYLDRNGGLSSLNTIPRIAHGKTEDGHFFVSIHGTIATSFMVLAGIDSMEVNAIPR